MKIKNIIYVAAAVSAAVMVIWGVFNGRAEEKAEKSGFMLDTYVSAEVYGKNANEAIEKGFKEVSRLENIFSAYKTGSGVYELNGLNKEGTVEADEELVKIIAKALEYSKKTDGRFDITIKPITDLWKINDGGYVPDDSEIKAALENVGYENICVSDGKIEFKNENTKIDLGAVAKGYCSDVCADVLISQGIKNAILDFGGNICALGENPETKRPWNVGIKKPFGENGEILGEVSCMGEKTFVVTSGAYERNFTDEKGNFYHHIFSPETGKPFDSEFDSVTIVSDNGTEADAFSTALFMCGVQEAESLAEQNNLKIILVSKDKRVYTNFDEFHLTDSEYTLERLN